MKVVIHDIKFTYYYSINNLYLYNINNFKIIHTLYNLLYILSIYLLIY